MNTVTFSSPPLLVSSETFYDLCRTNPDLQLERTSNGELIVMPPTGGETGDRNDEISYQLRTWNKQTRLGKCFNSSTGFKLPNGANRSPDASWVRLNRWQALTSEQRRGFPPLAPDFVVELQSPTDKLQILQEKMQEYRENGVLLGWLLVPQQPLELLQVEIYRLGQEKEVIKAPTHLSGEDVLPGFVLNLNTVFS